ncbi:uncharacterized protein [Agelaius tricolor]|uniref:uncharacterized protein isoform X1 n=1 Tax=Agelaius tricolor TaxID=9191 RepID=UPI0039F247FD
MRFRPVPFSSPQLSSDRFGQSRPESAVRVGSAVVGHTRLLSATLGCCRPHSAVVGSTRPHSDLRPYLTLLRAAMAAAGWAPLPGLSPGRGQSAGTAASARVTLSLPAPASPGARPAAQNAAFGPGAGTMPSARQQRREAAGGALRAGKIIQLLPSLPKALVLEQPKARGFSSRALRWRALVLPTLWAASREGRRGSLWDETAESKQRSSLGLEKGQGTNTVAPGHL